MTIDERVRAEDEALRTLIRVAGERAPLLGGPWAEEDGVGHAIRLPAPAGPVLEGRRIRARRRLAFGSVAVAASLLVAVVGAGAGVGSGAWQLRVPGLRADRGDVDPATLIASRGTKVGDVVNALDVGLVVRPSDSARDSTWFYTSGLDSRTPPVFRSGLEGWNEDLIPSGELDRAVHVQPRRDGAGKTDGSLDVRLARLESGIEQASGSERLGRLGSGSDGHGTWLLARPSAADGWLVVAALPKGAAAVQARVTGTDVVLPVDQETVAQDVCAQITSWEVSGERVAYPPECESAQPSSVLFLRIAAGGSEPPVDAITYVDKQGRYVVLDDEARVH